MKKPFGKGLRVGLSKFWLPSTQMCGPVAQECKPRAAGAWERLGVERVVGRPLECEGQKGLEECLGVARGQL